MQSKTDNTQTTDLRMCVTCGKMGGTCRWVDDPVRCMRGQIEDLRTSVIAFGGPWAVKHAERSGLPRGHLLPVHYDCLSRAGARMDDFTRADIANAK